MRIIYTVEEKEAEKPANFSFAKLVNNEIPIAKNVEVLDPESTNEKQKRRRSSSTRIKLDNTPQLPLCQTTEPYLNSYMSTQEALRATVSQIDNLALEVNEQLKYIKDSKVIKGKYKYISDLAMTQGNLLSAKIGAIREMNKTITDAHNLDQRRYKDNKETMSDGDDDKRIMDIYNAFIKLPINSAQNSYEMLGPNIIDATLPSDNVTRIDPEGNTSGADYGYQQYLQNITPEQNRMRYEKDPNIKTVVKYDQSTGNRWFDVIDMRTGTSIPNVAKPDDFLLEDMSINLRSGTARNSNANMDFPLITVGVPDSLNNF